MLHDVTYLSKAMPQNSIGYTVTNGYDGSYPLDRLTPLKGNSLTGQTVLPFRQCTIRNWTLHNCRIASKRRCHYLLHHLPNDKWVRDFCFKINLAIPQEFPVIEYDLLKAIGVYELVGG